MEGETISYTPVIDLTPERLAELKASAEKSVILCVLRPEELAALIRMAEAWKAAPDA